MNKELMPTQTAAHMVDAYQEARQEVTDAFKLMSAAKKRLNSAFGQYRDNVIDSRMAGGSDFEVDSYDHKASMRIIKKNAWAGVIDKCQIRNLLTDKRNKELEKQLEDDKLPELTIENIHELLTSFSTNLDSFFKEAVSEVFNWLRPPRSQYKTNTEFEIGPKVIKSYAMESAWNGGYPTRINYHKTQQFKALDNVFNLLDGKGTIKYPGDLITTIQQAAQNKKHVCETEYFKCKWFKNCNMHIEFKRMDLVDKLNRMAGGNRLKS